MSDQNTLDLYLFDTFLNEKKAHSNRLYNYVCEDFRVLIERMRRTKGVHFENCLEKLNGQVRDYAKALQAEARFKEQLGGEQ